MRFLSLYCVIFLSLMSFAACADTVEVKVSGVACAKGSIRLLLFDQKAGFPKSVEKAVKKLALPAKSAKKGTLTFSIKDLKAGKYAVVVIHDLDDNKKLATGLFGIPTEPVGISSWSGNSLPNFKKSLISLSEKKPASITLK